MLYRVVFAVDYVLTEVYVAKCAGADYCWGVVFGVYEVEVGVVEYVRCGFVREEVGGYYFTGF